MPDKTTLAFDEAIFDIFQLETLDGRMTAIREQIQPLFAYYAEKISDKISWETKNEALPIHIAKHIRRTVHPPENTWVAIGGNKRGYKKYPHFQLGINPNYVFITLSLIDNPLYEKAIAQYFSMKIADFDNLPQDMIVIADHTQLEYIKHKEANFTTLFERLEKVKKAEFMLGRLELNGSALLKSPKQIEQWLLSTVEQLLPFYLEAMVFYE